MKRIFSFVVMLPLFASAQLKWTNVDSAYGPLPESVHVYYTEQAIDTSPFRAYYVIADLKNKKLDFTTDTTFKRRITPSQFYEKNKQPLVVVNGTFFSFETNQNLSVVVKDGKLVGHNVHTIAGRGKDTFTYWHPYTGAIGISRFREADVAWIYTDSLFPYGFASQTPRVAIKDSVNKVPFGMPAIVWERDSMVYGNNDYHQVFNPWRMQTAIGGGPVLLQKGEIRITNNEELKFGGKAINDKHPRTAIGYTKDNKLIILVIEGRNPNAGGATLTQEAQILKDLGCVEALNLDGGGSSCLLVNGKETIKPSDKGGQRAVPAVFMIVSSE